MKELIKHGIKFIVMILAFIYIVSPIDFLPEAIAGPFGFIDQINKGENMQYKSTYERIVDTIAFFYLFDGIIIGVINLFYLLNVTLVSTGLLSSLIGYYPSNNLMIFLNFIIALSSIAVGMGLMAYEHWARIGAILLAIPKLIDFPVGTLFGIVIIALMIIPHANKVFGEFSKRKLPFRLIGIIVVLISFFGFAYLSGYTQSFYDRVYYSTMGFPECNINPMEKIKFTNIYGKDRDVIIELTAPLKYAVQQQNIVYQEITTLGGNVLDSYSKVFNGLHIKIDGDKLQELASSPHIKAIYENNLVKLHGEDLDSIEDLYCLNDCNNLLNTEWLWSHGYDGKGVAVAIIDTGINSDMEWLHRDGKSVVVAEYELYGDYIHWHGTGVACCIASQHETYKGVAPMADIIDVEVFHYDADSNSYGAWDSDILWGYEKVVEWKQAHSNYFVIASCSFGIPAELVYQ